MADIDTQRKIHDLLDAHAKTIDTLHGKVAALYSDGARESLSDACSRYKTAHKTYEVDVLGTPGANS